MRYLILVLGFVFCSSVGMGQGVVFPLKSNSELGDKDTLPQKEYFKKKLLHVRSVFFEINNYDSCMVEARAVYKELLLQKKRLWVEESDALMFIGSCFRQRSKLDSASFYYEKGLAVLRENGLERHPKVGEIYNHVANMFLNNGVYLRETIDTLLESLNILNNNPFEINYDFIADASVLLQGAYERSGDTDSAFVALKMSQEAITHLPASHIYKLTLYTQLARYFHEHENYQQAIEMTEKGLKHWQNYMGGKESIFYAEILTERAEIYSDMGDTYKAIIWEKFAHQVYERIFKNTSTFLVHSNYKLWQYYRAIKDMKSAREMFEQYDELAFRRYKSSPYWVTSRAYNKSVCYSDELLWKESVAQLLYADSLAKINYPPLRSTIQYSLSLGYLKISENEKALDAALLALDLSKDETPSARAYFNYRVSMVYAEIGNRLKAQEYADKIIDIIQKEDPQENGRDITQLIVYDAYLNWSSYLETNDTVMIKRTLDLLGLADDRINKQFQEFYEKDSKLSLQDLRTDILELFVSIQFNLFKRQGDIQFLMNAYEKATQIKDAVLMEAMRQEHALFFAGIPKELVERHEFLRKQVNFYEKQRFNLPENATQELSNRLDRKIFELSSARDKLRDSLRTQFPEFEKIQYGEPPLNLAKIQQSVLHDANQTLLEYFTGDSALYIFAIRRDTFAVVEVKQDAGPSLDSLVRAMRHGLSDYYTTNKQSATYLKQTADEYTEAAFQLYQKLVAPVAGLLREKVIVIPDGVLGYVPFDVLLTRKPTASTRFYSHAYFGKEKQISYAYSATLLREMQDKKHKNPPGEMLLALAPFFQGNADTLRARIDSTELPEIAGAEDSHSRGVLAALPGSGQEVKDISALFKGKAYYGIQSPKEVLLKDAGNYRIVHISTHGQANDNVGDYAWLAFAVPGDKLVYDKFYVKDIYNLSLNADLVTLSACETGIGELKRGEGIISLARAFAYAGAKSIVTTLWPVNDISTSELMRLFYQNLKKGMDKDTALWQAKKDFLNGKKKGREAHPYFWSGFIPVGDMRKIESN